VHWFARLEIGFGGPGLQENNNLLNDLGYGRAKMWAMLDAAYMFHRRIGAGIFMGMNRRSSQPGGQTVDLNAYGLFFGAEAPIMIWGKRAYAFHLTPRVGYLNGTVQIGNGIEPESQHAPIFGAAASFQSFTYHLGASLGWMFAPAGSPGELGRDHDFGGIYGALGGTIDG
jgi:hypothetical protein